MRPILLMPEEKDLIILASLGRRRHSRLPWSNLPTRVETTSGVRRPDGRLRRIIKVGRAEQLLLKARRFYLLSGRKNAPLATRHSAADAYGGGGGGVDDKTEDNA